MEKVEKEYGIVRIVDGHNVHNPIKTIQAIAKNGYRFIKWIGNIDESSQTLNPVTIVFSEDKTYKRIVAVFQQNIDYAVTVKQSDYGHATVESNELYPASKKITAIANDGYEFSEWQGDSTYITSSNKHSNPLDLSMVESKRTLELLAIYQENPQYTKIVKVDGSVQLIYIDGTIASTNIGRTSPSITLDTTIKEVYLGSKVRSIAEYCFMNCTALDTVVQRSTITQIGREAFYNTKLTSIAFAKDTTYISDGAFSNTQVQSLDLRQFAISTISDYCFSECKNLTSIVIPKEITSIGVNAFRGCTKLASIDLTDYVDAIPTIGLGTFPPVGQVANRKFKMHSAVESKLVRDSTQQWNVFYPEVDPQIADTLFRYNAATVRNRKIEFKIFFTEDATDCIIDFGDGTKETIQNRHKKYQNISHKYANNINYVTVRINDSLKSILLTTKKCISIDSIGSNITELYKNAFGEASIRSIKIPSTIKYMEPGVFYKCTNLTIDNITIDQGQKIGDNFAILSNGRLAALFRESNATRLDFRQTNLVTLSKNCFVGTPKLRTLRLPKTLQQCEYPLAPLTSMNSLSSLNKISIESGNSTFMAFGNLNHITESRGNKQCYLIATSDELIDTSFTIASEIGELMPGCIINSRKEIFNANDIQRISCGAFVNCRNLKTINVPGKSLEFVQVAFSYNIHTNNVGPWLYGGPNYIEFNGDSKNTVKKIQINCRDDQTIEAIAITGNYAYLLKPLSPDKVKCLTISHNYNGTRYAMPGMTNDSSRIQSILSNGGFANTSNISTLTNNQATKSSVIEQIDAALNSLNSDGLFIFHFSGFSGNENGNQYLLLHNGDRLYANELCEKFNHANPRIMAIFCVCNDTNDLDNQLGWAYVIEDYITNTPGNFKLCVYASCSNKDAGYMEHNIGHCFMTSLFGNIHRNNNLDSYQSLFENATTEHEKSKCVINSVTGNVEEFDVINPEIYCTDNFNADFRIFT